MIFLLFPITLYSFLFPFPAPVLLGHSPSSPLTHQQGSAAAKGAELCSPWLAFLPGGFVSCLTEGGAVISNSVPETWLNYTISRRDYKVERLEAVRATQPSFLNNTQVMAVFNFYLSVIAIINEDCDCLCSGEQ